VPGLFEMGTNTKTMREAEFVGEDLSGEEEESLTGRLSKMGADFASIADASGDSTHLEMITEKLPLLESVVLSFKDDMAAVGTEVEVAVMKKYAYVIQSLGTIGASVNTNVELADGETSIELVYLNSVDEALAPFLQAMLEIGDVTPSQTDMVEERTYMGGHTTMLQNVESLFQKLETTEEKQVNFHESDLDSTVGKEKYLNQLIQSAYDESLDANTPAQRHQVENIMEEAKFSLSEMMDSVTEAEKTTLIEQLLNNMRENMNLLDENNQVTHFAEQEEKTDLSFADRVQDIEKRIGSAFSESLDAKTPDEKKNVENLMEEAVSDLTKIADSMTVAEQALAKKNLMNGMIQKIAPQNKMKEAEKINLAPADVSFQEEKDLSNPIQSAFVESLHAKTPEEEKKVENLMEEAISDLIEKTDSMPAAEQARAKENLMNGMIQKIAPQDNVKEAEELNLAPVDILFVEETNLLKPDSDTPVVTLQKLTQNLGSINAKLDDASFAQNIKNLQTYMHDVILPSRSTIVGQEIDSGSLYMFDEAYAILDEKVRSKLVNFVEKEYGETMLVEQEQEELDVPVKLAADENEEIDQVLLNLGVSEEQRKQINIALVEEEAEKVDNEQKAVLIEDELQQ